MELNSKRKPYHLRASIVGCKGKTPLIYTWCNISQADLNIHFLSSTSTNSESIRCDREF